ncbi:MAG: hypothetical protein LBG58_07350 [Planctomycetaceae bacterium]|nr:hypothetical protein [Planctomycetaceae bacterium]
MMLAYGITAQQRKDGGWNFGFEKTCRQCSNGREHGSRIAATAFCPSSENQYNKNYKLNR